MKKIQALLVVLLITIVSFSFSGCAMAKRVKEGTSNVTQLSNGQYDIYVAGGIISDRSALLKKWEELANQSCNGNYEVTKEQTTGQSPGGSMTIEGRIRCK